MKVGIEVVTGFLGAGKSAFINSFIDSTIAENEKIIVITCEKGNTEIDDSKKRVGKVIHINLVKNDEGLSNKIYDLVKKHNPHRIIIEYNGTESLEYLYRCLFDNNTGRLIKLNLIYFVCDARNIDLYIKNMGEILLPFIQSSDVIVVNNCENIKVNELNKSIEALKALNHKAHILKAENNQGIINALERSKLLEDIRIRNMRVKLLDYMRK